MINYREYRCLNTKFGFLVNVIPGEVYSLQNKDYYENGDRYSISLNDEIGIYLSLGTAKAISKNISIGADLRPCVFLAPMEANNLSQNSGYIYIGGSSDWETFYSIALNFHINFMLGK